MTSYKVSYGRCKRTTFFNNKRYSRLVPGRLYFIKDTGEIFRATDVNSYEVYTNRIHIVDSWPETFDAGNIYIKENDRAKIAIKDESGNDTIVEFRCVNSSGEESSELASLRADVESIKNQLTWNYIQ